MIKNRDKLTEATMDALQSKTVAEKEKIILLDNNIRNVLICDFISDYGVSYISSILKKYGKVCVYFNVDSIERNRVTSEELISRLEEKMCVVNEIMEYGLTLINPDYKNNLVY